MEEGNHVTDDKNNIKSLPKKENLPARAKWDNKTEYLLSCLGYCIGIGNVWRFPYMCYRNGGGAFLVPYLLMLFFCGVPLFFLETSLGQFGGVGCISLFKISPLLKGAGYAILIVNLIVCTYFNTLITYPVIFLLHCFQNTLPWSTCDNPWNTENCIKFRKNVEIDKVIVNNFINSTFHNKKTPADEFFHNKILEISENVDELGNIVWPLFWCNILTWIITYLCIIKGVKTVGKVVYFTATFPFFILIILFIRGVTLPGAWNGIKFYLVPEWSQLTNIKVWADATIQIFFSLGPGWGGIVNVASYNYFRNNGRLDAIIVPLANSGTSIFAGFVVFSVLGFLAHETGLPVSAVVTGGPGLAFITYPEAISLLPLPQLWAVLFFLMLFFLGLDSMFVQIETFITALVDEFPQLRRMQSKMTIGTVILMGVISILFTTNGGMYWLQILDWYAASISVVLICLVEVFAVAWVYGVKNYKRDIEFMLQEKIPQFYIISWKYTTPVILLFMFIMLLTWNTRIIYNNTPYPDWMIAIGWCSCAASIVCVPLYIVYRLLFVEKGDIMKRIKTGLKSSNWGPANPLDKEEWINHISNKSSFGHTNDFRNQQLILEMNSLQEKHCL